ncbi:unnamed protein product [Nezara viridula]|uniref:Uncharacterized protein n=1 Tax=Nezara viridula TaxID=85310 RepID=A0A9P0E6S0_NEZVI|nr:unnamed protein product [Nezara viridula]
MLFFVKPESYFRYFNLNSHRFKEARTKAKKVLKKMKKQLLVEKVKPSEDTRRNNETRDVFFKKSRL